MMVGRVWCNWMCPFGILHHFFGWIGNRRNTKQMIEVNRYRKIYAIKYYILTAMLAMASLWMIPTAIDAPGQDRPGLSGVAARVAASGSARSSSASSWSPAWPTGILRLYDLASTRLKRGVSASRLKYATGPPGVVLFVGLLVAGPGAGSSTPSGPGSARRPRSTRAGGTARSRSACSTRSP